MSIGFRIKFHPNNLQNPEQAQTDRMILTEITRIQIDAIDTTAKPGTAASKPPPKEDVIKYLIEKGARQAYAEAKHLDDERKRIQMENAKAKETKETIEPPPSKL